MVTPPPHRFNEMGHLHALSVMRPSVASSHIYKLYSIPKMRFGEQTMEMDFPVSTFVYIKYQLCTGWYGNSPKKYTAKMFYHACFTSRVLRYFQPRNIV